MKKPADIAKSFLVQLGVGAATGIIRGWLNEQLKNIEPGDLNDYILEDRDLWGDLPEEYVLQAQKFRARYRGIFDKFEDRITTELIATWIKDDWPALYSTIRNTPNGEQWLHKQVMTIKYRIIEM